MHSPDFAVGQRVRVYPASSNERYGVIIDDFGDEPGVAVAIADTHIADASRRWAITVDDGTLVFVNKHRPWWPVRHNLIDNDIFRHARHP